MHTLAEIPLYSGSRPRTFRVSHSHVVSWTCRGPTPSRLVCHGGFKHTTGVIKHGILGGMKGPFRYDVLERPTNHFSSTRLSLCVTAPRVVTLKKVSLIFHYLSRISHITWVWLRPQRDTEGHRPDGSGEVMTHDNRELLLFLVVFCVNRCSSF